MQNFSRRVGIGSKSRDLTGACMINLLTLLSETGVNRDNLWRVEDGVAESTKF